ncbi:MAG: GbsR/MarR family transcriptional regulator [Haloferacaceae archaeon]
MSGDPAAAAREEVIGAMERSAEVYGLSRSAGRVYGVLYFADDALSIPELVEETGYAKSTISTVTRKLTRIGLIRRRSSGGGGRRVRFEPEPDLWVVVQDAARQHDREMAATQRALGRALDRLEDADGERVRAERERIDDLRATHGRLRTLLDLLSERSVEELIAAVEEYDGE